VFDRFTHGQGARRNAPLPTQLFLSAVYRRICQRDHPLAKLATAAMIELAYEGGIGGYEGTVVFHGQRQI
jgi:hypothetical protein